MVGSVPADAAALSAVAVLADEHRRRMYAFIRRAGGPVTRDEAAAAAGISRKLAAFHLDKLAGAGLLRAGYGRPAGLRRAGRAPKTYAPADIEVQVSIPPREHGVLAAILVGAAVSGGRADDARQVALRVAAQRGSELGAAERERLRPGRLGAERALTVACAMLERHGFEPVRAGPARVWLGNCPFQPLAAQAPGLVCGISQAYLAGYLDGLGASTATAVLAPQPGTCCVELRATTTRR
jgi:predicted ArsR family transcriptional regulator